LREEFLTEQLEKAEARGDTLAMRRLEMERDDARRVREIYSTDSAEAEERAMGVKRRDIPNMITLPVLEDGEIYIRFGKSPATYRPVVADSITEAKKSVKDASEAGIHQTVVVGNGSAIDNEQLR